MLRMAIFAANRCLQISLEVQSRSFLVSSLAKKGYNTSGPVRYIPKNHSQIRKPQKVPALDSCEKKEKILFQNSASEGKRVAHKLPEFDDSDQQNSLFHSYHSNSGDIFEQVEELSEFEDTNCPILALIDTDVGCMSGPITEEDPNSLKDRIAESEDLLGRDIRQDAEKLAIEMLAARAYTELELLKKLRSKKYPPSIVDSVITDIKIRGLLNDGLYAESFSRSRWLSLTWGPRRIKQALVQKGVKEVEAEKALNQVFNSEGVYGDSQPIQHGISKDAMDRLFVQASKQWQRGQNTSPENRKARIVRWLQYRGFSWGVTSAILKKLEAQYPP